MRVFLGALAAGTFLGLIIGETAFTLYERSYFTNGWAYQAWTVRVSGART